MRRLLVPILLVVLVLPAAASARRSLPGDGTLAIRSGDGIVRIQLAGAVIGRIDYGRIWVFDPADDDCDSPLVWDADTTRERLLGAPGSKRLACLYTGHNMRFRLVGADNSVSLNGLGISLSGVGRGTVYLKGSTLLTQDGSYSIDGGPWSSLPDDGTRFRIGQIG